MTLGRKDLPEDKHSSFLGPIVIYEEDKVL
jgi:hypothetical protein